MSLWKDLLAAATVVVVLFAAPIAMAKGPQGVGHGAGPTFTPGVPQNEGAGNSDWSGAAPGWSNAEQSKGWDGGQSPPGWDNNATGQEHGWGGNAAPSGIEKR